jgi:hypothetical protein
MAQFIIKMLDWVVNDLVVKHLANSKTFQRFALRTDTAIQEHSKKVRALKKNSLLYIMILLRQLNSARKP